ncbi:hypothetical protein K3U93_13290 [Mycobacterium malmoense]|uniref:dienelactone hydrolase family protein n=1 Tax=Mycobacterium malmoense TaxID=1780 RepID=UPI00111C064C|nr:hypothetical protein [Mycobacterium malmoense]QZA15747.1 hypothetical protein K3U93_13290 [Mycobacterium malmoense]UNB92561.1 hypothetical protein H5T25_13280 [Mycobacterium malmoense]
MSEQSGTASAPELEINESGHVVVFRPVPGSPNVFSHPFVDAQLIRAMGLAAVGAAAVGECYTTARRVDENNLFESWYTEWAATAGRVDALGADVLTRGHKVSAREAFFRGASYYRNAYFFLHHNDPRKRPTWKKGQDAFRNAVKLWDTPVEVVAIPYEKGKTLPGYFFKVDDSTTARPTLLGISGADGTYEEVATQVGKAAIERGYNLLAFEMPGQFGTVLNDPELVYRTDTWVPVGAAVDYALTRPEVDPQRLAFTGYSWGGAMGPRAVSREKRIKAIIANSLVPECRATILMSCGADPENPDASQVDGSTPTGNYVLNDFSWRCGVGDQPLTELKKLLDGMILWGLEDQLTTPLLNVTAAGEGGTMQGPTDKFFDGLTCPKTSVHLTSLDGADLHCQANNLNRRNQIEFDWLDETFNKQTAK